MFDSYFRYNLDNMKDGFYIAPAFMDKLVVHITKNFMNLPNIKVYIYILCSIALIIVPIFPFVLQLIWKRLTETIT